MLHTCKNSQLLTTEQQTAFRFIQPQNICKNVSHSEISLSKLFYVVTCKIKH